MGHQAHFCSEVNYEKGNDEKPFSFNLDVDDSRLKHVTSWVVYEVIKDNGYQREFDTESLDLFIQEAKNSVYQRFSSNLVVLKKISHLNDLTGFNVIPVLFTMTKGLR